MKIKILNYQLYYITIVLFVLFVLLLTGCKKNRIANLSNSGCEIQPITLSYTPLTNEKYIAIINNIDQMSSIMIGYYNSSSGITTILNISGGQCYVAYYLNQISIYTGNVMKEDRNFSPATYKYLNSSFDLEEMQTIFEYLHANNNYFFDNTEFEGLPIPYEREYPRSSFRCNTNYGFSLFFIEPNDCTHFWAIIKCLDEYPGPDHPLYGLFQILENDFISKFD